MTYTSYPPVSCNSNCRLNSRCHVKVQGADFEHKTAEQVYQATLARTTADGFRHVLKREEQNYALLHFGSHLTAAMFCHNSKFRGYFFLDGARATVYSIGLPNGEVIHFDRVGVMPYYFACPLLRSLPPPLVLSWQDSAMMAINKYEEERRCLEQELIVIRRKRSLLQEALHLMQ